MMGTNRTGRNNGKVRAKFSAIEGPFSPRRTEMLASPAYRALSLSEHRVLSRIEIELGNHTLGENGKLIVTHRDFQDYGVHKNLVARSIRTLAVLGFIEVTVQGRGGAVGEFRVASRFRLTFRATSDARPTDEWRRLKTLEEAEEIARSTRAIRTGQNRNSSLKKCTQKRKLVPQSESENTVSPVSDSNSTTQVQKLRALSKSRGGWSGPPAVVFSSERDDIA